VLPTLPPAPTLAPALTEAVPTDEPLLLEPVPTAKVVANRLEFKELDTVIYLKRSLPGTQEILGDTLQS
jgi:hypothetical protein